MYGDRRAISTVIAALVVTVVFLGLASAALGMLYALQASSSEAVRREAERAMEAFFMIYWVNSTHVRLFNNHSSLAVVIRYWISSDSGGVNVIGPLNSVDWSVQPKTFRDVLAAESPRNPSRQYKVVSERGSVFTVGDAPSEPWSLFSLRDEMRLVRPGFSSGVNGPLTQLVLATGPDFTGGPVTVSCVSVTPAPASCSSWSVSFNPSSPVTVPPGGAVVVNILASVPAGTPIGTYFMRIRVDTGGFAREFLLRVAVGDFTFGFTPSSISLEQGCATTIGLVVTPTNYRSDVGFRVSTIFPPDTRINYAASPDPVPVRDAVTTADFYVHVNARPTGSGTRTVVVAGDDGLGPVKTSSFVMTVLPDFCILVPSGGGSFVVNVLMPAVVGCRGDAVSVPVEISSLGGWSGTVTLTFTESPNNNVIRTETFTPNPVTVTAGGTHTATFSFVIWSDGTVTVIGESGSLTSTSSFTVSRLPPAVC